MVRGLDAGAACGETAHFATVRQQAPKESRRFEIGGLVAGSGKKKRTDLSRRQIEAIDRGIAGKPRRRRIEMQRRAARYAVEAFIFKQHVGRTEKLAGTDAAARTLFAAHLEQIGEIIVEQQRQFETHGTVAVIL